MFYHIRLSSSLLPYKVSSNVLPYKVSSSVSPYKVSSSLLPYKVNSNVSPSQVNLAIVYHIRSSIVSPFKVRCCPMMVDRGKHGDDCP